MNYPDFSVVGHRGAMAHAPENSVQSFALAEKSEADEIELDVRCTSDGELIILHDATLDRLAAGAEGRGLGPVAELPFDQLRSIPLDSGRSVLTLHEAFDATTVALQVEIKERRCVDALAAFMYAHPNFAARSIFTSFDGQAIADIALMAPQVPRGIIFSEYPSDPTSREEVMALLMRTGSDIFHCGWKGLTADVVEMFHDAAFQVRGWPVRTLGDMQRAVAIGVDGITSDDPALARAWRRQTTPSTR